jgi:hypothetical protein
MKTLITILLLIIPVLVFALPGVSPKKAVWEANTEPDLAGYYLYWGDAATNFNDTDRVDVGNVTEYSLDGIPDGVIVITAYDVSGNESEISNIVPLDNTPPTAGSTLQIVPQ